MAGPKRKTVIDRSRMTYATPRADIEQSLLERLGKGGRQPEPKHDQSTASPPPIPAEANVAESKSVPEEKSEPAAPLIGKMAPDSSGLPPLPKKLSGKGGPEHRSIQEEIKRLAEAVEYQAETELKLEDGSLVDVSLENDERFHRLRSDTHDDRAPRSGPQYREMPRGRL